MTLDYTAVKAAMGITHDYSDDVVLPLIDIVAGYCLDAGVSQDYLESPRATGLLMVGAKDIFDFGIGADFSALFHKLLQQAKYTGERGGSV